MTDHASAMEDVELADVARARGAHPRSAPPHSQAGHILLDGSATPRAPLARRPYAGGDGTAERAPFERAAHRPRAQSIRFFSGHYHRLLVLGAFEAMVVAAAFYAALAVRFQEWTLAAMEDAVGPLWPRVLCATAAMALCMGAMGLYQLRQRLAFTGVAARVLVAVVLAEVLLACLFYAVPPLFVGRGVMLLMAPVAACGLLIVRRAFTRMFDGEVFKRRVMVWGCGDEASTIGTRLRRRSDQRGFRIVGYVQCPDEAVKVPSPVSIPGRAELMHYIAQHRVEEIVVAMDDRRRGFPTQFLRECRMLGVRVRDIVSFLEHESGHVNVELAKPSWLIFSDGFRCDAMRASGKRAFDIAVALCVLVLSSPLALLAALAIRLEDRGPIFYRQERTGQHGRLFRMIKFRSMSVNAEAGGAVWAQRDDPRVTRVGNFLRRTRIDEIPQALNVLMGHMSFVGPRPERPAFVEKLGANIPFYMERHFVKPGITGWAQVSFPYGSSEADAREKLGYDLYYVKNHSLLFDLMVLLRTVEIVLFRVGSR